MGSSVAAQSIRKSWHRVNALPVCENAGVKNTLHASRIVTSLVLLSVGIAFGQSSHGDSAKHPREYTFEVVHRFPHDPKAFTQGFVYHGGYFYEGTGIEGQSSLRQVRIETGEVIRKVDLSPELFGEGITLFGDEIFQITWESHVGFVYKLSDFSRLRTFSYPGEGWGITTDGHALFMSDGTPEIRVLEPATFAEKRRIKVHDGETPVKDLNELEFVEGEIYANVWHSNRIARISPQTGEVVGWIDLTGLMGPFYRLEPDAVLNGIAYDPEGKRLFVTGKLWPAVFEIRVIPARSKQ
jgi:glutaminyl-peptide cyclotransferase